MTPVDTRGLYTLEPHTRRPPLEPEADSTHDRGNLCLETMPLDSDYSN